jgi:hypothetical protein
MSEILPSNDSLQETDLTRQCEQDAFFRSLDILNHPLASTMKTPAGTVSYHSWSIDNTPESATLLAYHAQHRPNVFELRIRNCKESSLWSKAFIYGPTSHSVSIIDTTGSVTERSADESLFDEVSRYLQTGPVIPLEQSDQDTYDFDAVVAKSIVATEKNTAIMLEQLPQATDAIDYIASRERIATHERKKGWGLSQQACKILMGESPNNE